MARVGGWLGWRPRGGSVDGVEGAGRGRRGLLAVVDRLVVAQTVQAGVHALANVTHWLPGRSHVYVLNVSLEPRQRGQTLVTGVASVIFLGGAGATWSQHKPLARRSFERTFNALSV